MKVILPEDKNKKEYIIFLYKNRNKYHGLSNKDINNLVKLINVGKLEDSDYPIFKNKKENKKGNKLKGYSFNNNNSVLEY